MSQTHTGNIQPGIDLEEHDGLLNAKRVAMASTATIYAVVNTGAAGVQNSMVTLNSGPNYIGLVTTTFGSLTTLASGNNFIGLASIRGDVDLNTGARWIGLATVTPASAWPDPKTFIGLATVSVSNPTLYAVVNTGAVGVQNSMATLNAGPNYIGLVTTTFGSLTTLGASPNYVGLASVNIGGTLPALTAGVANIGFATVYNAAGAAYIGLASVNVGGIAAGVNYIGLMSINGSVVNLAGVNNIGFATVYNAAGAAWIGLATVVPTFNGDTTIFTGVYSTTGNSTIFVAPASNRFFIQNLHVSSLGRAEVEFRSGATTLIPFTSLSTTSGFNPHFGRDGLPSRAQADALVANLNGAATIAVAAHVRFAA